MGKGDNGKCGGGHAELGAHGQRVEREPREDDASLNPDGSERQISIPSSVRVAKRSSQIAAA